MTQRVWSWVAVPTTVAALTFVLTGCSTSTDVRSSAAPSTVTAISSATAPMAGAVLHASEEWTQPGHTYREDLWTYPADAQPGAKVQTLSRTSQDGRPYREDAIQFNEPNMTDGPTTGFSPDASGLEIDYDSRTWRPAQDIALMVDDLAPGSIGSTAFDPAPNSGSLLRQQVAAGKWRQVGTSTINRLRTIELSETDGETRSLYVDPVSYLIVREASTTAINFEYLPPQPNELALVQAAIPDGFTQAGVHLGPDLTVAQVQAQTGLELSTLQSVPSTYANANCAADYGDLGPKVTIPAPQILNATITLATEGQTLAPPTAVPRFSAERAGVNQTMFVHDQMPQGVGPIYVLLANLTSRDGQSTNRLVWVRIIENYPFGAAAGGGAPGVGTPATTTTTTPRCLATNDIAFYDAQTGQAMFEEN